MANSNVSLLVVVVFVVSFVLLPLITNFSYNLIVDNM